MVSARPPRTKKPSAKAAQKAADALAKPSRPKAVRMLAAPLPVGTRSHATSRRATVTPDLDVMSDEACISSSHVELHNEYEEERNRHIAENNALLESLGLRDSNVLLPIPRASAKTPKKACATVTDDDPYIESSAEDENLSGAQASSPGLADYYAEEEAVIAARRKKDETRRIERDAKQSVSTPAFVASLADGTRLSEQSKSKDSHSPPQVMFKKRAASTVDDDSFTASMPPRKRAATPSATSHGVRYPSSVPGAVVVDLTGSSPESSPTSRSGPSERNNTTLAYWRKYNKDPRAAPVVAAALEYYRFRLITGDIWADKDTRRFLAGASLNDAMDVLEYERFEPLDGMVEAIVETTSAFRGRFKAAASNALRTHLGMSVDRRSTTVDPKLAENVAFALLGGNFRFKTYEAGSTSRTGAYRNPVILDVIKTFFASTEHMSQQVKPPMFAAKFQPMPERIVAFALTAIICALNDLKTGRLIWCDFKAENYKAVMERQLDGIEEYQSRRPENKANWAKLAKEMGDACSPPKDTKLINVNAEPSMAMFYDGE